MHRTRLLNEVRDRLKADGYTVSTEPVNSFRLQGGSGTLVSGQADLVAAAPDGQGTAYDVKTGTHRDFDVALVMIYVDALPLVAGSPWKDKDLDGCLVYGDGVE